MRYRVRARSDEKSGRAGSAREASRRGGRFVIPAPAGIQNGERVLPSARRQGTSQRRGGGRRTLLPDARTRRSATERTIGNCNVWIHERPFVRDTPPQNSGKKDSLRQVSWLSVLRVSPAFPDASSGWGWRNARRLQLRGQPRTKGQRPRTGFPFNPLAGNRQ